MGQHHARPAHQQAHVGGFSGVEHGGAPFGARALRQPAQVFFQAAELEPGPLLDPLGVGRLAPLVFLGLETLQVDHETDHRRHQQRQQHQQPEGGVAHARGAVGDLALQQIEIESGGTGRRRHGVGGDGPPV